MKWEKVSRLRSRSEHYEGEEVGKKRRGTTKHHKELEWETADNAKCQCVVYLVHIKWTEFVRVSK